jgi:hypothetical protein
MDAANKDGLTPALSARARAGAFPDATTAQLLCVAAAAYLLLPIFVPSGAGKPADWYCRLADAFLQGRLDVALPGAGGMELIPAAAPGRWFVGYPPVPAVLLMPVIAVLGNAVNLAWVVRVASVLNVVAFDWAFSGVHRSVHGEPPTRSVRLLNGLLFSLGTMAWHVAIVGGDWHWAHVVAVGAFILAIGEYYRRRRFWLVGVFVAIVLGCRPPSAMACVLFFAIVTAAEAARGAVSRGRLGRLAQLAAAPAMMVALLGVYNAARFGSPWDFGYSRMVLMGEGKELMERYGQFDWHYAGRNLYWFFIAPPVRHGGPPWLLFDLMGLGLLWTTPVVLYCFRAPLSAWATRAAWIGIAAALVPLATYFSTGYVQFGHRYGMDYLPLVMLLVVMGMGRRPSRLAWGLSVVSMAAQAWGAVLWLRYVR